MDADEQARRWVNAQQKLQAAQLCYDHQLYGESVTRSYYACYQAMWAAVDYAAASASFAQADFGLDVVKETLQVITQHTRWAR